MTLLGKRVIADAINHVEMRSSEWVLLQYDWRVLVQGKFGQRHTDAESAA